MGKTKGILCMSNVPKLTKVGGGGVDFFKIDVNGGSGKFC